MSYPARIQPPNYPGVQILAFNVAQFQHGIGLTEFMACFGSEEQCAAAQPAQRRLLMAGVTIYSHPLRYFFSSTSRSSGAASQPFLIYFAAMSNPTA